MLIKDVVRNTGDIASPENDVKHAAKALLDYHVSRVAVVDDDATLGHRRN